MLPLWGGLLSIPAIHDDLPDISCFGLNLRILPMDKSCQRAKSDLGEAGLVNSKRLSWNLNNFKGPTRPVLALHDSMCHKKKEGKSFRTLTTFIFVRKTFHFFEEVILISDLCLTYGYFCVTFYLPMEIISTIRNH